MFLNKKIRLFLVATMLVTSVVCHGQTQQIVDNLATRHQASLDEGKDMLACTSRFYAQMDSLLNLTYNDLRKKLKPADAAKLKTAQRDWIKKRDAYFKKQEQEVSKEMDAPKSKWGEMQYMILYDAEANFVKGRVLELARKLEE